MNCAIFLIALLITTIYAEDAPKSAEPETSATNAESTVKEKRGIAFHSYASPYVVHSSPYVVHHAAPVVHAPIVHHAAVVHHSPFYHAG